MLAGLAEESGVESGVEILLVQPGILSLQGCCHRISQAKVRYWVLVVNNFTWCRGSLEMKMAQCV